MKRHEPTLAYIGTGEYFADMQENVDGGWVLADEAEKRIQELLALVAKLSNTVPFAEEVEGWEAQRRAMIAEVGTLRARAAELEDAIGGAAAFARAVYMTPNVPLGMWSDARQEDARLRALLTKEPTP